MNRFDQAPQGAATPIPPSPFSSTVRSVHEAELIRLTSQYAHFAGTARNALNLVAGLRSGSAITLYEQEYEYSFMPPTQAIGWGNVQRILNLARNGLAGLGIVQPSPPQIAVALMGGTLPIGEAIVRLPGILRLYCSGVAWTRIAFTFARPGATTV